MEDTRGHGRSTGSSADNRILYSTTEGRQKFPDILQTSYGDKSVIGFGRYGRAIGAVVPMEAVRVLAGFTESVDEDVRKRIVRTARSLLKQLPAEALLCGLEDEVDKAGFVEMEEISSRRRLNTRTRKRAPHK